MPIQRVSKQFKQIQHDIENQAKYYIKIFTQSTTFLLFFFVRKRIICKPEDETQYIDKQRGISVVLDAEGGSGDLKGDIKASGLDNCEDDDTIPFELYLEQAEYFLSTGLYKKSLNRLNIALRLEPDSSGKSINKEKP